MKQSGYPLTAGDAHRFEWPAAKVSADLAGCLRDIPPQGFSVVQRPSNPSGDAAYAHVEWSCSKCDAAGRVDLELPAGEVVTLSAEQRADIEQQVRHDHEQSAMREKGRVCVRTPNWAFYAS